MAIALNNVYKYDDELSVWLRPEYKTLNYSDGDETELRIAEIIKNAKDLSSLSEDLPKHCTDWPSTYHLTNVRSNIIRPLSAYIAGKDVLEIGSGCGAITRYLGESAAHVLALEGSVRRASITKSRTRDLHNVTALAENFNNFETAHRFDVITLIGVLEYASVFSDADNPALGMLKKVKQLLKPDGKLIIAIENQLGLKYFAAAPEDHIGQAMYGIENRYQKNQVRTFGKLALTQLLQRAGFPSECFLAPFPDYKMPVSVVTEAGFSNANFNASDLAWQSVRRDAQLPAVSSFSAELVWPTICANGLGMDVANSFLVMASLNEGFALDSDVLAYHYNTGRLPKFCKEAVFRKNAADIQVSQRTFMDFAASSSSHLLTFSPSQSEKYHVGVNLAFVFTQAFSQHNWSAVDIAQVLKRYVEILQSNIPMLKNTATAQSLVAGEFLDALPRNISLNDLGQGVFFDLEWVYKHEFPLSFLLFRALLNTRNDLTCFGNTALEQSSYLDIIQQILSEAGFSTSKEELDTYIGMEADIQAEVSGVAAERIEAMLRQTLIAPIATLNLSASHMRQTQLIKNFEPIQAELQQLTLAMNQKSQYLNELTSQNNTQQALLARRSVRGALAFANGLAAFPLLYRPTKWLASKAVSLVKRTGLYK